MGAGGDPCPPHNALKKGAVRSVSVNKVTNSQRAFTYSPRLSPEEEATMRTGFWSKAEIGSATD